MMFPGLKICVRLVCLALVGGAAVTALPARAAVTTQSIAGHGAPAQRRLTDDKQALLQQSLRRITGCADMRFEADGRLTGCAGQSLLGGSPTARAVLLEATRSNMVFIIEDHSKSNAVHFGQLDEGLIYDNDLTRAHFTVWRVRLDFADFQQIQAAPPVRAAFDEGFTLLHELLHGLGLKDAAQPNGLGECEAVINRARAEQGLPQRDLYYPDLAWPARGVVSVRLQFSSPGAGQTRRRKHYLFFMAKIGPPWTIGGPVGDCRETGSGR